MFYQSKAATSYCKITTEKRDNNALSQLTLITTTHGKMDSSYANEHKSQETAQH